MGKIVIPKNSASLEEVMGTIQIYYDANDWLSNSEFIRIYKERVGIIGDDTDSSAYTKKTEIGAYYGFIKWQDINKTQSPRKITTRGRNFINHYNDNNIEAMHEDIMKSLEEVSFGRNNYACRSCDSDIEPPALFLRAMIDLEHLTNTEFAYLVFKMEYEGRHYTETIEEIKKFRSEDAKIFLPEEANKLKDPKPILILERWGVLISKQCGNSKQTMISPEFFKKYKNRLCNLKIYNIDKNIFYDEHKSKKDSYFKEKIMIDFEELNNEISVEKLAEILKKMYNSAELKTTAVHMFGFKYAEIIEENNYAISSIIMDSGIHDTYKRELAKGINMYEAVKNNEYGVSFYKESNIENGGLLSRLPIQYNKFDSLIERNRIIFGAPGTGKSFRLNKDKAHLISNEDYFERVTFHPDYSYANFVGTYKPVPKGELITYEYVPGPFMRTLVAALNNPERPCLLLIEEINRAQIAAVFGDVFQLLDRDANGVSEYAIATSDDMRKHLSEKLGVEESLVKEVRIPSNMFIWTTMNSADQGVFPMDTAFKRRWDFEYIGIDDEKSELPQTEVASKWNIWRTAINDYLSKNNVNEDKLMGPFFISKSVMDENDMDKFYSVFKNKVLMYLFEDAAKRCRGLYSEKYITVAEQRRYSAICDKFDEVQENIFNDEIFKQIVESEQP